MLLILMECGWIARAQEAPSPGPPRLEDFEADADGDGVPDGWYNARDAKLVAAGGVVGRSCVRFENDRPGRPARLSRAFGVDGRTIEALVLGIWVRGDRLGSGERVGDEPGLMIDFLGPELKRTGRGQLGGWTRKVGTGWSRLARRIPVPAETRDAILTVGLLGGTGRLEIDGLAIEPIPRGGAATTNLIRNGDFELGDPEPASWAIEGGARRVASGYRSDSALELNRPGARAIAPLAIAPERVGEVEVRLRARGGSLRGGGGARAEVFFLDADGRPLPGADAGAALFRWSGSFDWKAERATVRLPRDAAGVALQVEKTEGGGSIRIDDVQVVAAPSPEAGRWVPDHVATKTDGWRPYIPAATIATGSALDASGVRPRGEGFVSVKGGRLVRPDGTRARFFGVVLLPPLQFPERRRADALAARLARSGVNLVKFEDFDVPLGPGRSLFEDDRDDTQAIDADALARFDHLVAALRARGVSIALEFLSARRFRGGDRVPGSSRLPPGGGPAAGFDPSVRALEAKTARDLLAHVNPETGRALRDDPVLAWAVLAGERSLFDLIDEPDALPADSAAVLKDQARQHHAASGRRGWSAVETAQWSALAGEVHKSGLKVPLAGSSHWRREPDYVATLSAPGLDLIEDRLYWSPPPFASPGRRSLLWQRSFAADAAQKRRADRPYVVGSWCARTDGAWALPYEAADLLAASRLAGEGDWDALVRRGVFAHPETWGAAAPGTSGGEDLWPIPGVLNADPALFALLPHAASLFFRGGEPHRGRRSSPAAEPSPRGRLVIDTPFTQGLAGWSAGRPAAFATLDVAIDQDYGVVVASALGPDPIARARRLLVSAVARAEPTGLLYADATRRVVADPGRPPIRMEPVRFRVTWRRPGTIRAYALDNAGARVGPVPVEAVPGGGRLVIDDPTGVHWEVVIE